MTSSGADVARWFSDDESSYRCQHQSTTAAVHPRHGGNGYSAAPFFHHPPRRHDAVSAQPWPSTVNNPAAGQWSPRGTSPPWAAAAARFGYNHRGGGLEGWPSSVVSDDNVANAIFANRHDLHHHHHHEQQQQQQQQCSVSPDDVTASLHKYPWMSIIGKFN